MKLAEAKWIVLIHGPGVSDLLSGMSGYKSYADATSIHFFGISCLSSSLVSLLYRSFFCGYKMVAQQFPCKKISRNPVLWWLLHMSCNPCLRHVLSPEPQWLLPRSPLWQCSGRRDGVPSCCTDWQWRSWDQILNQNLSCYSKYSDWIIKIKDNYFTFLWFLNGLLRTGHNQY